jgi:UDP-glucuronate decarboxylase
MRNYDAIKWVLVTDGAGFLRFHLYDQLIADGHDLVCADNFYTG